MRLHRLEITAFGPFGATVDVDFDELSGAGVFLLTGATGAGKSSVLDAVCFALYGDVPGDRASAKRLRSDHAEPGVAPRVRLECTLAGRRFRLTRSPAWERPKKRGTGTTREQPSVSVSERVDGEWRPVTTRLDEAGQLVSHLLGMNLTQFTQVALLPQGRFQSFLRARSEDRHRLLQQLFRTGRFEAVEAWLRRRRSELASEVRRQHQELVETAGRVSEAADAALPEAWVGAGPGDDAAGTGLGTWAVARLRDHRLAAAELTTTLDTARETAARASTAAAAATALADEQERHRAAHDERAALLARADEVAALRRAVTTARRAAAVAPLERARAASASAQRAAEQRLAQLRDSLTEWDLHGATAEEVADLAAGLTRDLATTEALVPDQRRLEKALGEAARCDEERASTEAELAALEAAVADAPARLAEATRDRDAAAEATADLEALAPVVEIATRRLAAAREAAELEVAHAEADRRRVEGVDAAHTAKETWLAVQAERITGMAAELAGRLAVGHSCPVCGSAEHPSPAQPHPATPDETAEREARRRSDDAEAVRLAREEAVRDLRTRIALAGQVADGRTPDRAVAELADLTQRQAALRERAAPTSDLEQTLKHVRDSQERDLRRLEELRVRHAALSSTLAGLVAQCEEISGRLRAALDGSADTSLEVRRRRLSSGLTRLREVESSVRAVAEAQAATSLAAERAAAAAIEAGFADAGEALAAVLPESQLREAETALHAHDTGLAGCERLLADPKLAAAAGRPAPDLAAVAAAADAASETLVAAESAGRAAQARLRRLTALVTGLQTALGHAVPLREELALVSAVSLFVDGRAPDNRLQMRLSAYVLAARLGEVVAAANERLATMSDRRYALEHTARRGAGETRGGLSLLVRDDWTGEARDPATLSGGETFVVSLALALGLADVVTREAGGADLDTLFVDEGFGALDADTLDDVLDTLDTLREGGRVVGVVSHVPQMRERIPTHLEVRKGRHGSAVAPARA
jgi:DNA repair protein SbcC/Rad50